MKKGIELLDTYTRNNIVLYLDLNDTESFSQQNKDCAYSCALMYCQTYAECITDNQSVPLEVISVLKKVVRVEDVKELGISIVDKIFQICCGVLHVLRNSCQLSPLLMELMNEYHINDIDRSRIYEICRDIPPQMIQHILQCCICNNHLYTKKSSDAVIESKEDIIATFIRNRESLYYLLAMPDASYSLKQHKFIVASFDDIFVSAQNVTAIRSQIKSIFDTAIDEVELVIDVGQLQSFPDYLSFNDIRWDTDLNIVDKFPLTIRRISIIGDRLTTVGECFLSGCTMLTAVTIPYGVKSIMSSFLHGFTNLTTVTIPDSVTSIGNHFLSGCTSLSSLTIPDSVISIGNHFLYGCTSLTSITIPFSVASIGNHFLSRCTSLTSITIPFSITSIKHRFLYECTSLTALTIPSSVVFIGDNFLSGCNSLTNVAIPDSVTSIGIYFLSGCTSLTSITLPNSITNIRDSFLRGCTSLTSITIPDSIISIGNRFLSECTSLNKVTIPDSVTSIGDCFLFECTSLTSVTIPYSVTTISNYQFLHECDSLTTVTFLGNNRHQFEELIEILQSRGIRVVSADYD